MDIINLKKHEVFIDMTILEAISSRHSVRAYRTEPIPQEIRAQLDAFAETCSKEGNLHIFIRYDDPEGFDSRLAHYGRFRNVNNYIVLAGTKDKDFDLRCGYYGEKLVLYAQQLGLNTCWTALTFNKRKVKEILSDGEALCMVIALGYGEDQGTPHKGKTMNDVSDGENAPEWFSEGVNAALLAPTAVNQQKFRFSYRDGQVHLRPKGFGTYLQTDLGIVKYHFEAVTGKTVIVD